MKFWYFVRSWHVRMKKCFLLYQVLDDNRELFISETQTLIKAHPGFMVFATQNPAGLYGGRKVCELI